MDDNNAFSHFGPDPFLPFINTYEEQFQPADQDPWANAHFGFDGTQDLSIFNSNFLNNLDALRPFVPAYSNQETPVMAEPNATPSTQVVTQSIESPTPALESTSSESPAPSTKKQKTAPKKPASVQSDPSDKEVLLDKRARNLVASAKFREKKKMREAELERTAKEMTEKAAALEKKVEELEGQIKLLRSLLLDKTR